MQTYNLIRADVMEWLRGNEWMVLNGFIPKHHAVLSDPPYGIAFMNKKFDSFSTPHAFQAWVTEWGRLLLSFVYPGAVGLFFGGDRTHHRLMAGLEDAGWEIATTMVYMYGVGFPKGHDISKAIDREAGAENILGYKPDRWTQKGGVYNLSSDREQSEAKITAPATPLAQQWDGYNTALKPAYEPIILARAPRDGTYAQCATRYGTSALNVDGCRIPATDKAAFPADVVSVTENTFGNGRGLYDDRPRPDDNNPAGRWPANVILDDAAAAVLDAQSGERPAGGASRFFYTAKAATWEREVGLEYRAGEVVNDGRKTAIDNPYQRGGKPALRIRQDLSPEKRAWVEAELKRRGIEGHE